MNRQLFPLFLFICLVPLQLCAESWSQSFTAPTGARGTITMDYKVNEPNPCRPLLAQMNGRQFNVNEEVDILEGLQHYVVFPQGAPVTVTIKVEVVGGIPPFDNLLQGYRDGVFFSTPMAYSVTPGLPNVKHHYSVDVTLDRNLVFDEFPLRMFEFFFRNTAQTELTRTFAIAWIVTGNQWLSAPSWKTATPELPHLILRDPPGDGSYAFVEENKQVCHGFGMSLATDASATAFVSAKIGKKGSAGVLVEAEYEAYAQVDASLTVGVTRNTDRSFNMCFETKQRFETDRDNPFIVGQRGDLYLTMAT
ncbi:MAG: hypothetical protein AAFN92_00895, partial [Bacteroidota bacterium]